MKRFIAILSLFVLFVSQAFAWEQRPPLPLQAEEAVQII